MFYRDTTKIIEIPVTAEESVAFDQETLRKAYNADADAHAKMTLGCDANGEHCFDG
jgi:hypothetical protein